MVDRLWDDRVNLLLHDSLGPVTSIFDLITHLGDGALLIVAAVLIYWFGAADNERDRAFVIAVGTAAFALAAGLKGIFQIPRPSLAFSPAYYPGYTFPSAHAMGAAAFYGSLAVTMRAGKRWQRYLVAALLIVGVSLSRLTHGVHFLGDVLVGASLGLLLVWIGLRWRDHGQFRPAPVFILAGVIAVITVLLGSREYVPIAIGGGFGGAVGWWYVLERETSESGAAILMTGIGLIGGIAVVRTLSALLSHPIPGAIDPVFFLFEVIAYGVLMALIMAVPAIAVSIEETTIVNRLQAILPFRRRTVDLEASDRSI